MGDVSVLARPVVDIGEIRRIAGRPQGRGEVSDVAIAFRAERATGVAQVVSSRMEVTRAPCRNSGAKWVNPAALFRPQRRKETPAGMAFGQDNAVGR